MVIMEKKHLKQFIDKLPQYFLNLGYTMKVETPVYHLEEVEFCQAHPVAFAGGWKMVRNVRTAMSKDVHCVNNIGDMATRKAWSNAQCVGGLALCTGIPVMEQFYRTFKRYDVKTHQRIDPISNGHKWRGSGGDWPVTAESRASFWQAFKLTGDEQHALEDRLQVWEQDIVNLVGTDHHEPSVLDFAAA